MSQPVLARPFGRERSIRGVPTAIFALGACLGPLLLAEPSRAQVLDARRIGMGGVTTSDNGSSATSNVAFRGVPAGMSWGSIPLPIGVVQYFQDPVTFDPDDPDFNVYNILDLVAAPPVGWVLTNDEEVSSDISIFVARDSLSVDLGEVQRVVPEDALEFGGVYHLFGLGKRFGSLFVQVNPILQIRNAITPSDNLRDALKEAEPFRSNTRYELVERGIFQTSIAFQAGLAFRAFHNGSAADSAMPDPRRNGSTALYVGIGPKYLMGVGFGEILTTGGMTTADTLFGSNDPVTIDLTGTTRYASLAGPGGLGHGYGLDAGAVFYWNNFELGVGVSDLGDQIHYDAEVSNLEYDYLQNAYQDSTTSTGSGFTIRIPTTTTINVAKRTGPMTIAADVALDNEFAVRYHVGVERWFGPLAARTGTFRDAAGNWQVAVGSGYRFRGVGLDAAIATRSQGSDESREAELLTSFTIY